MRTLKKSRHIIIAGLILFFLDIALCMIFKCDIQWASIIVVCEIILLMIMGEKIKRYRTSISVMQSGHPYVLFNLVSLALLGLSIYLINQTSYTEGISYFKWLWSIKRVKKSLEFEVATIILTTYILVILYYRKWIIALVKQNVQCWLPSIYVLIIGIGFGIYFKEGMDHFTKTGSLLIGLAVLAIITIYMLVRNADNGTIYSINSRYYMLVFTGMTLVIMVIGLNLPQLHELPGTRWLHHIVEVFGARSELDEWIPYETRLREDVPFSEAELFQVQSSEPLYLRGASYSVYQEGIWSLSSTRDSNKHLELRESYLDAEYEQTHILLDEILWLHSQDNTLLGEYSGLANYEKSVITKGRYRILQNPINKINYLTVNGVQKIEDSATKHIYYYHRIDSNYFYGDKLVEPGEYQVYYYNRIPRVGSREYLFLHELDGARWQKLCETVLDIRARRGINYEGELKCLSTYTQLARYKNTQKDFLQVPNKMKLKIHTLTQSILKGETSDWGRAEAIATYLQSECSYNLKNKTSNRNRVFQFLFETKEGVCQDFATSMVLMCRSIDIPAKYVTGYLVQERDRETGNYIVREKDAHAFVEVYIAGYGWMTFDPTPAQLVTESLEEDIDQFDISDLTHLILLIVMLIVLIVISGGGKNYIQNKWWQLHYLLGDKEQRLVYIMQHTLELLKSEGLGKEKHETLEQYTQRLKENQLDISMITMPYEVYKYGLQDPTKVQVHNALIGYKYLRRQLKRNNK